MNESRRRAARLVFYRDLFLFWPFFLSCVIAGSLLFSRNPSDRTKAWTFAAMAVGCLLLARRRLLLTVGAVGFLASLSLRRIRHLSDWRIALAAVVLGTLTLWGIRTLQEFRWFRRMLRDDAHELSSDETTMTDLLVMLAGLLSFFVVGYLMFH